MWAMGVFVEWATRGRTHARWRQRASGTSWLAWEGGLGGGSGSTLPAAARGVLQRGRDAGAGGGVRVFNRKRELFAIPFPTRVIRRMGRARSEEHTSELQSLMRISYAVFCLKKKKQN